MKPSEATPTSAPSIGMFAVLRDDGLYMAGYDPALRGPTFTENIFAAKLHTNKYDIRLRPDERLVEVRIALTPETITLSHPFRPKRRSVYNIGESHRSQHAQDVAEEQAA